MSNMQIEQEEIAVNKVEVNMEDKIWSVLTNRHKLVDMELCDFVRSSSRAKKKNAKPG